MQNNIPAKTLLKIFDLIQKSGVEEDKVLGVSKYFDPEVGEKILQAYIQKGKVEDLDLSKLIIKSIPSGLKCKKLNLSGNNDLKHLPKVEAERIWAMYTNIQSIEEGLKCKELHLTENKMLKILPKMEAETIWAVNTNIERIEKGLKCRYLYLGGNKSLKHLPQIEANENIFLVEIEANNTNIQTIEEGLKCKELSLRENKVLKHLPKVEVGKIDVTNTNIESIGEGLKCIELILKGNKTLEEFSKGLEVRILDLYDTYFSETYTEKEVRKMIKDNGGRVGKIWI